MSNPLPIVRPYPKGISKPFGQLTVISTEYVKRSGTRGGSDWYATVQCTCGTIKRVRADGLHAGMVLSCGCKKKTHNLKHGMRKIGSKNKTYQTWDGMKQRILNPNSPVSEHYSERGIDMDPRWEKFENFLEDMGPRPDGLTLERLDNDKGYSKENCVWATQQEQMLNTRRTVYVVYNGKKVKLFELAKELNLNQQALSYHIRDSGRSTEEAIAILQGNK